MINEIGLWVACMILTARAIRRTIAWMEGEGRGALAHGVVLLAAAEAVWAVIP